MFSSTKGGGDNYFLPFEFWVNPAKGNNFSKAWTVFPNMRIDRMLFMFSKKVTFYFKKLSN